MEHILKYKLLNLPLIIWGLQLLYVAIALVLFVVLLRVLDKKASHLLIQIVYVVVILILNIIWRVAVRKIEPGWF